MVAIFGHFTGRLEGDDALAVLQRQNEVEAISDVNMCKYEQVPALPVPVKCLEWQLHVRVCQIAEKTRSIADRLKVTLSDARLLLNMAALISIVRSLSSCASLLASAKRTVNSASLVCTQQAANETSDMNE